MLLIFQNKTIFLFLKSVKNTKFVVTTWVLSSLKCTKIRFRPGLHSGPCWGSLQRSPRPLAGGRASPKPHPRSRPSIFGPSGLNTSCLIRHSNPPLQMPGYGPDNWYPPTTPRVHEVPGPRQEVPKSLTSVVQLRANPNYLPADWA